MLQRTEDSGLQRVGDTGGWGDTDPIAQRVDVKHVVCTPARLLAMRFVVVERARSVLVGDAAVQDSLQRSKAGRPQAKRADQDRRGAHSSRSNPGAVAFSSQAACSVRSQSVPVGASRCQSVPVSASAQRTRTARPEGSSMVLNGLRWRAAPAWAGRREFAARRSRLAWSATIRLRT